MKPKQVEKVTNPEFADIKDWFNENLSTDNVVDLDDQHVYENVYHAGKWAAIFQATERGAQGFMQRVKPRSIMDLAAATSIYRPGPLAANVDKMFVRDKERLEGGEKLEYEHEIIEDVLGDSYSHMIYQESFMMIGNKLGKLSWADCDKLRKVLVKKSLGSDVKDEKAKQSEALRVKFVAGAAENGMSEQQANRLWDKMAAFNGYGFNRSLTSDTQVDVYDSAGTHVATRAIADVRRGDSVMSRDESSGENIFVHVDALHDHGVIDVNRYTFDDGTSVECTADHKFRTTCGKMLPIREIIKLDLDIVKAVE